MQTPVIVGVPCFNEEKNILHFLRSLEKQSSCISAVIISDDSTDNTPNLVEKFARVSSLDVIFLHHCERRGAAAAWNEIFDGACRIAAESASGTEALVLYDADVIPSRDCTAQLASRVGKRHRTDGRVVHICASRPEPVQADSIAARASAFISDWLRHVRRSNEISKYTVMGRALAISTEAAERIRIPENLIAIDLYLQCKAIELGMALEYNDEAVVYFSPASTIRDFASQVLRSFRGHQQLREHTASLDLNLTALDAVRAAVKAGLADPVGLVSAMVGYSLMPYYRAKLAGAASSALWDIAMSSKSVDTAPVFEE